MVSVLSMVSHDVSRRVSVECVSRSFEVLCTLLRRQIRTFASSAPSGIAGDLMKDFGMSQEVATLAISLFVAGYCVGPIVFGPLSETVSLRLRRRFNYLAD